MSGQNPTCLLTGANQGIGFGTACGLAKKGYNLVLACRNEQNAKKAVEVIQKENPSIVVEYVLVDLASLESVKNCIRVLIENGYQFDVVILNAGVVKPQQQKTVDGYDTTFQVNYLSQYLIAQHLINNQTHPIKVITLTSIMYNLCNVLRLPKNSSKWLSFFNADRSPVKAYALSKFSAALLSQSLNQQGVESATIHPGVIPTSMFLNSISRVSRVLVKKLNSKLTTVHEAAENVIFCVENEIPEGKYNSAGRITTLNKVVRCSKNIHHLEQMNTEIMKKHGL